MDWVERALTEEQRMMRGSCRAFVDDFVSPFIRRNWQREWLMDPDARLPAEILREADRIGIRTLGVPEEFGGVQLDPASEVRALVREAACAVDEGAAEADALCNMAKVFASEEIMKVAQHAMELHGGNGAMLDFGIEKLFRDASIFLHMDATADISRFKIVKSMFPRTAGAYAGPE